MSEAVSMRCSHALDRLSCSSKAVSAVRFAGDRTCADCESPEHVLILRHQKTKKLPRLGKAYSCATEEPRSNATVRKIMATDLRNFFRFDCRETPMLLWCASDRSTGHLSQKHWVAASRPHHSERWRQASSCHPLFGLATALRLWGYGRPCLQSGSRIPCCPPLWIA